MHLLSAGLTCRDREGGEQVQRLHPGSQPPNGPGRGGQDQRNGAPRLLLPPEEGGRGGLLHVCGGRPHRPGLIEVSLRRSQFNSTVQNVAELLFFLHLIDLFLVRNITHDFLIHCRTNRLKRGHCPKISLKFDFLFTTLMQGK